jgi:hypothetical protein
VRHPSLPGSAPRAARLIGGARLDFGHHRRLERLSGSGLDYRLERPGGTAAGFGPVQAPASNTAEAQRPLGARRLAPPPVPDGYRR